MYAIIESDKVAVYPASLKQIRSKFPNTSFALPLSNADLADLGVVVVSPSAQPTYNTDEGYIEESTPVKTADGWTQQWVFRAHSESKLKDIADSKIIRARGTRNQRLAETDYLALSDATLTDEMRTYRQALRDVPAQSGFPDNITWPTKPS